MADRYPILQVLLNPNEPIDVPEFAAMLNSFSRQYEEFAVDDAGFGRPSDARLLISSVSHGSIDIAFQVDWESAASILAPAFNHAEHLLKFASHLKKLIGFFQGKPGSVPEGSVSVKDAEDVFNIVKPIADHGGTQNFNIINVTGNPTFVLSSDSRDARNVLENASREKARLLHAERGAEIRRAVSMVWTQTSRDGVKTRGTSSPDRAKIDEIDPNPRPVLFTAETSHLKHEMMQDQDNPYKKVYFVDVEVSRVENKVTAYRVIGYHGEDELPDS